VQLSIRTAIPKTGSPWHLSLKKAMALGSFWPVLNLVPAIAILAVTNALRF